MSVTMFGTGQKLLKGKYKYNILIVDYASVKNTETRVFVIYYSC